MGRSPASCCYQLWSGWAEAERRPYLVYRDLPDRLDALVCQGVRERVAVEVGAQLACLWVRDPRQLVAPGGLDGRHRDGGELSPAADERDDDVRLSGPPPTAFRRLATDA
jgi:hypothetical protein